MSAIGYASVAPGGTLAGVKAAALAAVDFRTAADAAATVASWGHMAKVVVEWTAEYEPMRRCKGYGWLYCPMADDDKLFVLPVHEARLDGSEDPLAPWLTIPHSRVLTVQLLEREAK